MKDTQREQDSTYWAVFGRIHAIDESATDLNSTILFHDSPVWHFFIIIAFGDALLWSGGDRTGNNVEDGNK